MAERPAMQDIEITHADRVLFPDGTTKGDLAGYYAKVADSILPHLRDRPLMLQRFPRGVTGSGFYQKDVEGRVPEWVRTVEVEKEGGTLRHLICDDPATLAFIADQDCVTLHSWTSRADRPRHPDRLVFDLDPSVEEDFATVRQAAYWLREILDEVTLSSFVQTTGSRGLHVIVPLRRESEFDTVRKFARAVGGILAERYPEELTVEMPRKERGDRVYIDVLRNAYAQTYVAPYSVRPKDEPTVATPLRWDDLADSRLSAQRYTIHNVPRRLAQVHDAWPGFDEAAGSLKKAIDLLQAL
ncbi:MAG TPA: non-homologous end-joining DNA ligase [Mycobacteriales bacterium]|nr:non-homologous end-joining DNA ligase [Mycobacteriales bacterium]